MNSLTLKITKQGKPVFDANDFTLLENTDRFIIGSLNVRTKWCFAEEFCGQNETNRYFGFSIIPSDRTKEKYGWDIEENEYEHATDVIFEGLDENWDIFMIECVRYELRFVLRNHANDSE